MKTGVRFRQNIGKHNKKNAIYVQGEPLLVINGFINPIEWPYKWVSGAMGP